MCECEILFNDMTYFIFNLFIIKFINYNYYIYILIYINKMRGFNAVQQDKQWIRRVLREEKTLIDAYANDED